MHNFLLTCCTICMQICIAIMKATAFVSTDLLPPLPNTHTSHKHRSPLSMAVDCVSNDLAQYFQYLFEYHNNQSLACQISQTDQVSMLLTKGNNFLFCRKYERLNSKNLLTQVLATDFKRGENHISKQA